MKKKFKKAAQDLQQQQFENIVYSIKEAQTGFSATTDKEVRSVFFSHTYILLCGCCRTCKNFTNLTTIVDFNADDVDLNFLGKEAQ